MFFFFLEKNTPISIEAKKKSLFNIMMSQIPGLVISKYGNPNNKSQAISCV